MEAALRSSGLKWSSFRPQYITGARLRCAPAPRPGRKLACREQRLAARRRVAPRSAAATDRPPAAAVGAGYGANKDCEEYFFDRIVRGRPCLIPGSGVQLTSVSHAEDLGSMLALAVGNPAAHGQVFNATTNKAVTLAGLARLCAKVMGAEPVVYTYNPKIVPELDVKKIFPFRPVHFYAEPRNAMALLGWQPRWTLEDALRARYVEYTVSGRGRKDKEFPDDERILKELGMNSDGTARSSA